MSLDATRWAWKQKLTPSQKLILLALADRAAADDMAYPSYDQLIEDTGLDRKTIWSAIKVMKEAGLLADTGLRKGSTGQVVVWQLIGVEQRKAMEKDSKNGTLEESQNRKDSKNGTIPVLEAKGSENGMVKGSKNGIRNLPKESTKESTKHRAKARTVPIPDGFAVSDRVKQWAQQHGYSRLDERLRHFVGCAKAKGYTYADWDQAFMNAIRDDWAKLNGGNVANARASPMSAREEGRLAAARTIATFGQSQHDSGTIIDVTPITTRALG